MKGFISPRLHPFVSLMLLTGFVMAGMLIGMFLATVALKLGFGYGLQQITEVMQTPLDYPDGRQALLVYQAITHFVGFTVGPAAFLYFNAHYPVDYLSPRPSVPVVLLLASAVLIVLIMPANSWLIDWNANVKFPEFLQAFEKEAKETEERLKVLTQYLTKFDSVGAMLLGVLIVAIIPAIGEELLFRGVVQQELIRWFRNPHVGIWLAAFLFGAIHFQFYGFFPRMILGVVLGYLYFWSKNIWVPIAGHFMNNGFTVFILYLQQRGSIQLDIESTEASPWYLSLVSLVISLAVMFGLHKAFRRLPMPEKEPEQSWF
ncbi:CPBP family intramembrane glutamic endopeptidase [Rufibacter sp. LB8]|uniref:CPBP family intramembrane glutamic endopeptidase n=1 Tax=Rufibacter sp. LB8 TaxID=2777781 RepID=UPI00178C41D2|nr:CPBP family intramembrane glutamic endopeptidase [Rufibacter sp. LB8]